MCSWVLSFLVIVVVSRDRLCRALAQSKRCGPTDLRVARDLSSNNSQPSIFNLPSGTRCFLLTQICEKAEDKMPA